MKFEKRNNFWYASYQGQAYVGKRMKDIVDCINQRNNTSFEV